MARAARMALDATLLSIEKVRPLVSSVWGSAKNLVGSTPVKPLVHNPLVRKVEGALGNLTDTVVSKIESVRDKQLPGELRYLEKELEKTRRRMIACKTLKPELTIAWHYCKIECAPPMTIHFFAGSGGAQIEKVVGGAVNNFMNALESQIRKIDENEARAKREKEEKIKAEQDKIKAEELKKRQEAIKKAEEAKKAKEKTAAPEKKEEPKKAEAKAEAKPEAKPEAKKKPDEKKKSPPAEAKKPPKKEDPKNKK